MRATSHIVLKAPKCKLNAKGTNLEEQSPGCFFSHEHRQAHPMRTFTSLYEEFGGEGHSVI